MEIVREYIAGALLLVGALLLLTAGIGLLRMPDLFLRMSSTSKASSLGVALILLGVAVGATEISVVARAIATILFIYLTAPVASHMIGRAGYIIGVPLWRGTVVDDLHGCYDVTTNTLASPQVVPASDQLE